MLRAAFRLLTVKRAAQAARLLWFALIEALTLLVSSKARCEGRSFMGRSSGRHCCRATSVF